MLVRLWPLAPARPAAASFPWATCLGLLKLRIVALLVFVSLVAAVLAGHGTVPAGQMLLLALAGALSSAGAAALNQYFERDLDAAMARTRQRPLPAGKVAPRAALSLGIALIIAALPPALAIGPGTTIAVLAGALCYVGIYTLWLKRSSAWNVPIGGIAGSCAVLAGWLAMHADPLAPAPLFLATILFFWNQSHFWAFAIARQEEYRLVGVPMLPVVVGPRPASRAIFVNTLALVLTSLAMYFAVPMGSAYLVGATGVGALFLYHNLRLVATPTPRVGWGNFKFSGIYLLVLFLAIAVDSVL